jgi:hypothetical protein
VMVADIDRHRDTETPDTETPQTDPAAIPAQRGAERRVSVVIPTTGRPSLHDAASSALAQIPAPLEVIVVVDGTVGASRPGAVEPVEPSALVALGGLACDRRVRVVATGGGAGPAGARMIGAGRASAEVVAFLDDDDEWCPGKLAAQLEAYAGAAARVRYPVVTCRAAVVDWAGADRGIQPRAVFDGTGELADYLFRRRDVRGLGFVMGASTLLCGRDLLTEVPFDPTLRLHEDWDWLLRVTARPDSELVMIPAPAVRYRLSRPADSASRPAGGWEVGLGLADRWELAGQARGDFLLGISAGMAMERGEWRAASRLAARAARGRGGRPGRAAWSAFAVQALVPTRLVNGAGRVLTAGASRRAGRRAHGQ